MLIKLEHYSELVEIRLIASAQTENDFDSAYRSCFSRDKRVLKHVLDSFKVFLAYRRLEN